MLGKAIKDGKTKRAFRKKRICDAIADKFYFFGASCQLRLVQAPVLIKRRNTVLHCPMKFEFHNYLASFFKSRYFKVTSL